MTSPDSHQATPKRPSSIYGPVHSWRFGQSLGIDLLLRSSICSFNCIYCQLGRIREITARQEIFVPTARVLEDLGAVRWNAVDVVTFSGSGEPTLALNLGEVIDHVKDRVGKPVIVLTNATLFQDAATRVRVRRADRVVCKLDAATDATLERFNRPAPGITVEGIVEGILRLREEYQGTLSLQCMFMPTNMDEAEEIARLAARIRPDEIQVNTPRRPRPSRWVLASRGRHDEGNRPRGAALPTLTARELKRVAGAFRDLVPGARIVSAASG